MSTESQEEFQRVYRRRQVAKLYLRGWTQSAISEKVGASQATISRDVAEIRSEWREETAKSLRVQQEREQARIDALECEIWEAWEKSKEPICTTRVFRRGDTNVEDSTKTMVEREGDLRYLVLAQKCIPFRRRALMAVHDAAAHATAGDEATEPQTPPPTTVVRCYTTVNQRDPVFHDLNARVNEADKRLRAFKEREWDSAPNERQRPADDLRQHDPDVIEPAEIESPAVPETNPDGGRAKQPAETLTGSSHPAPDSASLGLKEELQPADMRRPNSTPPVRVEENRADRAGEAPSRMNWDVAGDRHSPEPAVRQTNPDRGGVKQRTEALAGSSHPAPDSATLTRRSLIEAIVHLGPADEPCGVPTIGVPRTGAPQGDPRRYRGSQGVGPEGPLSSGP